MSKKVHVTMSKADYAALQAWKQQHASQRPELYGTAKEQHDKHHKKQQQPQPKPQPQGGLDGFTVFLLVVVGLIIGWGFVS